MKKTELIVGIVLAGYIVTSWIMLVILSIKSMGGN